MTKTSAQSPDLTPTLLEMRAQMAQMQAELSSLKQRAQTLPAAATTPPLPKSSATLTGSSTRRKTLKRMGLALLGGAAAATALGGPPAQAKIIANPTLGTSSTSKAGALVLPPTAAAPFNNAPNGFNYGLIASASTSALDLSTLFNSDTAVHGISPGGTGVYGISPGGTGVHGGSTNGIAVYGYSSNYIGVYGDSASGFAGYFFGNVQVVGTLSATAKNFKIDHPIDPVNKYLYHTSVESPDMLNIYNGNVTLDSQGEATITMPDWFEALNSDFRYQLTCLGEYAPVFVAQEITNRQFKIAGGKSGQKVSWLVTGIRQDAYAKAHRSPVEEAKNDKEKGKYLHPELYGQPEEKSVSPRPQHPPQGQGQGR